MPYTEDSAVEASDVCLLLAKHLKQWSLSRKELYDQADELRELIDQGAPSKHLHRVLDAMQRELKPFFPKITIEL